MNKSIYLNFTDLNEEEQEAILLKAIDVIETDEAQVNEIIEMYGSRTAEVIRERAEREMYNFNYVFNI